MGVNFSSFEIGRRALRAGQLGLAVTGQNIANVNTPGYTRQRVQLSPTPADGANLNLTGNGVSIDGVQAFRDRFIESRVLSETAISGRLTARRDALASVDAVFNDSNSAGGVQSALNGFFNSFRELEAHPESLQARGAVVAKGAELGSAFAATRARLVDIRRETDGQVRATVDEINSLSRKVAELNAQVQVAEHSGANASELRDVRAETVKRLTELSGARAVEDRSGAVTLTLADGKPLVVGNQATPLEVFSAPPDGLATVQIDGQPAALGDGQLKGLFEAIDEINSHLASLDALAVTIADRVNTLHAGGTDLDGNTGTNFFTIPADGSPVTAATLSVNPALRANPRLVVASPLAASSPQGATVAGQIASLLNETTSQAGGRTGSFSAIYASIVADAGAGVRTAEDALGVQQSILAQTTAQRESISGVSLDEEAINLLQYQKAYEAAARFLKIADELTQTILSLGG
ncbi:MAG: flagellar hook-associated protein FlgK [Pyrinomonadaceae bacterium]